MHYLRLTLTIVLILVASTRAGGEEHAYFCIKVVDDATGRGVPLVELKTVNNIRYFTDSAGIVAFREPGLMNQTVFFHVKSHGYEYPKDGLGYRGARLQPTAGGEATLRIKRINIAERLYRVTGAGIYRDSELVGKPAPIKQPLLNGQVFGSDSVVNTVYNGKIYWFWGDTNRPSYPLGNFHVPGAVSKLPGRGGLNPEIGVNLEYFLDKKGFVRPMAKMPGQGPTWIGGLLTLPGDGGGGDRLFAAYVKIKPPLTVYERGLAEFNDDTMRFDKLTEFDMGSPLFPSGHPFIHKDGGVEYVYFTNPFPVVRVRATASHLRDLSKYESYTCLKKGSRADSIEVDKKRGAPWYRWKTDTIPFTPKLQARLIKTGQIKPANGLFHLTGDAGKPVVVHSGSVYWNSYRKRWIMIAVQSYGTSLLGEVWYAESKRPVGPWTDARKVVSHERYSFYNPKQQPMFDQHGGRIIYFEGTYTNMFSGNKDPTPRYNYNQILYKLDLANPRLRLPPIQNSDAASRR